MRGFAVGSLALIVLYAVLQPNAASTATSASNVLVAGMRRLLSPEVAGVPNRAKGGTTVAEPPAAPSLGGTPVPIPNP